MRLGELIALDWKHVDLVTRVAELSDTKNGESRRVPLSSRAADIIRTIPRHISKGRLFWRWKRTDSLEPAWRRAVGSAQLENLRFHDLRHDATPRFFERGFNIMEVSVITGHKTLQMLKRYTHLNVENLVERLG